MLRATFLHTPSIGPETERALWKQGATDWETFLRDPDQWKVGKGRRELLIQTLEESAEALEERNYAWFANRLPTAHHWRAFPDFEGEVGYLDIETTGSTANSITVIGLYRGGEMLTFVRGRNLHLFPQYARECAMLVTYNGNSFDIPALHRVYPEARLYDRLHLDLCPALRRLGYKGGLKGVERQLGIERSDATEGLSGWDAVNLWWDYRRGGSEEALETLVRYNQEDTVNLEPLARFAYDRLASLQEMPTARVTGSNTFGQT